MGHRDLVMTTYPLFPKSGPRMVNRREELERCYSTKPIFVIFIAKQDGKHGRTEWRAGVGVNSLLRLQLQPTSEQSRASSRRCVRACSSPVFT